jgi:molecular chaperone GrpE
MEGGLRLKCKAMCPTGCAWSGGYPAIFAGPLPWQNSCGIYICNQFLAMDQQELHKNEEMTDNTAGLTGDVLNADDSVAGTSHLNEAVATENEMEKLQAELAEQKDKYLRLFAEFDNFKRRTAKERIELMQTAGREVITSLLDVLDDCERAEKTMETSQDAAIVKEGVTLVFAKLRSTLEQKGLKPMESVGAAFDPDLHEAITEIPAPTTELQGKVIDQVQKGYYLNDKIIRFAKVVVGK